MTNANNISLEVARRLTETVEAAWKSGEMQEQVTPTTRRLLDYWFGEAHCEQRTLNFHEGQRRAILNIIYLHEVMKTACVMDYYAQLVSDLMATVDMATLSQDKYSHPKYAVKMATGTGKTWVMHALMIWQVLNARHEDMPSGRYTKNFLIVAPGLIVYDRLQDAFCGRIERGSETRRAETNDFYRNKELLLPEMYRQEVFSFIQTCTVTKDEGISRKTTGDGLIALTNWHLFENQIEDNADEQEDDDTPPAIISDLLPVRPGKAAGNDLSALDRRYLTGEEIKYLASLSDIMVINDEAHHIHELTRNGEVEEVEWQKVLNMIAAPKGNRYMQVDFSATPYDTRGSGRNKVNCYFPHIVVDFDLLRAMRLGLVKTLLLDKRQDFHELEALDYRAERDDRGKVTRLSEGQRLMIRTGLAKLRKLKDDFRKINTAKNPKMLIMCEDTNVSPLVVDFLKTEGLDDDSVVNIDSNRRGEVSESEWKEIKAKLFDIDRYEKPEVIVSVLMLREGFDVNNICVIVPLRSSDSSILLEQTIGRGLRLMWREPEYLDTKHEDRRLVLVEKRAPKTYIDMLSIVEHPKFIDFYHAMIEGGLAAVDEGDIGSGGAVGDIIKVGLKQNYEDYDMQWPIIIRDAEEEISPSDIDISKLRPFELYDLNTLRRFLVSDGETFISQELTSKTQFGQYRVTADLFNARSYNEYLQKMLHIVTVRYRKMPNLQIEEAKIVGAMDAYIRTRIFSQDFNPFNSNDWKILLAKNSIVTEHIIKEIAEAIYYLLENIKVNEAQVEHIHFSSVSELVMRERFSLPLRKTIYERTGYPSHGGGLEKEFAEFLDNDSEVERFLKINESRHSFAIIYYIRQDGLMATYHPDFIVATKDKIYLIETKGNDKVGDHNVKQKQRATVEWVRKINELAPAERMEREWEYVLLREDDFYALSSNGATITDICQRNKVSMANATGNLFA